MVSRDLVPMRERIAGPHGTGKPLQIAVDCVTGTTEATQHLVFNRALGCGGSSASALSVAFHELALVTHQPLHSASLGAVVCFNPYVWLLCDWPWGAVQ